MNRMDSIKSAFKGLYMAFGMFCTIPLPKYWDASCAKHVMPWLPVVGAAVGAAWYAAALLLDMLRARAPDMLLAGALALAPLLVSGFIHLDGYLDTSDAVLSRRSPEEKLRILKDPHSGAFAVIMAAILFIMQFAAAYSVFAKGERFALLLAIPVMSRCCSALSILCLKPLKQEGYASMFRPTAPAAHRVVAGFEAACALALAWALAGAAGLAVLGAVALGYAAAMARAYASLRGVSGDLAGFAMVIGELSGLVALAVA